MINALGFHVESGTIANDGYVHELCHRFSNQSSYKFCPGIDWNAYKEKYHQVIRYHLKSVKYSTSFQRVDSVNCPLWFKQPVKARAPEKYASEAKCSAQGRRNKFKSVGAKPSHQARHHATTFSTSNEPIFVGFTLHKNLIKCIATCI